MSQSRRMSAIESATNLCVGWLVALGAQAVLFPAVGVQAQVWQHLALGTGFTVISFLRSFALRRLFERVS